MIEPTDEMIAAFDAGYTTTDPNAIRPIPSVRAGLAAVLAVVERQVQEQYGEAYQRGWWAGQHRLCPRCGVELEREVAAERQAGT